MAFNTGAKYSYLKSQAYPSYTRDFADWHAKSHAAFKDTELISVNQGVYQLPSNSKEKYTWENAFLFINERRKEWKIKVRPDGIDVCNQYQTLIERVITKMAGGDGALVAIMLTSTAKEIRSKHRMIAFLLRCKWLKDS